MLNKFIQKSLLLCLLLVSVNDTAKAQAAGEIQTGIDVLHGKENTSLRIRVAYASQITPKLSAGLGTGYTHYNDPLSMLPLFLDLKYALRQGNTIPFLFLRSGYSFSILTDTGLRVDEHSGGWLLNPGLGIQFATRSGAAFYLSGGYDLNHSMIRNEIGDNRTVATDITYKRLMVGVGLSF